LLDACSRVVIDAVDRCTVALSSNAEMGAQPPDGNATLALIG